MADSTSDSSQPKVDFAALSAVIAEGYQEAAIIQAGPPIEIYGQRAAPTIVLKPLQQTNGKFYYECKTHTGGYMQLGWAGKDFKAIATEGKGAGDDAHSWAFDGYRSLKWHANKKEAFGKKWSAGDVIGVAIDIEGAKINFSLNGVDLGTAFDGVDLVGDALYPCITLLRGERVTIHLGVDGNPFLYKPPDDFKPLTITQDVSVKEEDYNKFSSHTVVINMGLSESSFHGSFPGEMMVTMMRRGLAYEKKKNAMLGAGYDATIEKTEAKEFDFPAKLAHCDPMGLTRDEILALICYTLEKPPVYRYFNNDNRKGYSGDGLDFPILSYLLKEACRKIVASYPPAERTRDLYRGTSIPFSATVGEIVRFGAYTSASQSKKVADDFQKQQQSDNGTRFVIASKLGAPIMFLSAYPEEEEVLIPPFETFEVVKVEGTKCVYLKSVVPDDLVDAFANNKGNGIYQVEYLGEKLKKLNVDT